MIAANTILGIALHAVGALSAAFCYTPQKATRGWSWQTNWLAQASVCWPATYEPEKRDGTTDGHR